MRFNPTLPLRTVEELETAGTKVESESDWTSDSSGSPPASDSTDNSSYDVRHGGHHVHDLGPESGVWYAECRRWKALFELAAPHVRQLEDGSRQVQKNDTEWDDSLGWAPWPRGAPYQSASSAGHVLCLLFPSLRELPSTTNLTHLRLNLPVGGVFTSFANLIHRSPPASYFHRCSLHFFSLRRSMGPTLESLPFFPFPSLQTPQTRTPELHRHRKNFSRPALPRFHSALSPPPSNI